jgi:short-subunit dehydrogenase
VGYLVNNAGVGILGLTVETPIPTVSRMVQLNVVTDRSGAARQAVVKAGHGRS